MRRRINFAALLLVTLACTTAVQIPTNRYGLAVVPDVATYERLVRLDPGRRLVDVATIPGVIVDVRYATTDNFMKRKLYPIAKAYLRAPAADALRRVQDELAREGLGIKVWDGYRPYRVTEAMWEPIRNPDYVADPAKGSRHNRGAAVDLTLVDRTGRELSMPTAYDDFTPRAAGSNANSEKLRAVMERHGYVRLPSEWWHFDFVGWERFELMDVGLEELEPGHHRD